MRRFSFKNHGIAARFIHPLRAGLCLICCLAVLALSMSGIARVKASANDGLYTLPVFETSDIHGYIADKDNEDYLYLLSYISDKVKDVRGYGESYNKDAALLLDGGDIYQGSSMSNLLDGESVSSAYVLMDYDAVTIGNHEFDWGIENVIDADGTMPDSFLYGCEAENSIPVVASNLFLNNSRVDWTKDYVILNKTAKNAGGEELTVRIGVIGYLEDYAHSIMQSKFIDLGYSIQQDPAIPNRIASELELSGAVDAVILLCHADARETAESLGANSAIDLVLGGHSHKNENGVASNGIPYMEPTRYGGAYCRVDMVFKNDGGGPAFHTVSDARIETISDNAEKVLNTEENYDELDAELTELTDKIIEKIGDILDAKIGYITTSAEKKGFIEGSGKMSTTGGNWMSSIYMRAVESDIAFTNYGGVRYDFTLPTNETTRYVTIGEIYSNYPFGNYIFKYELTYAELLEVFSYALKDEEHKTIVSVTGIDCYYQGEEVNALVKDGVLIYQSGEWTEGWKDRKLTAATNEFVGTSDAVLGGMHNPLVKFNDTPKLLECFRIDVGCAVDVLTNEAMQNVGALSIDTAPHFIEGVYTAEAEQNEENGAEGERTDAPMRTVLWISLGVVCVAVIATAAYAMFRKKKSS